MTLKNELRGQLGSSIDNSELRLLVKFHFNFFKGFDLFSRQKQFSYVSAIKIAFHEFLYNTKSDLCKTDISALVSRLEKRLVYADDRFR